MCTHPHRHHSSRHRRRHIKIFQPSISTKLARQMTRSTKKQDVQDLSKVKERSHPPLLACSTSEPSSPTATPSTQTKEFTTARLLLEEQNTLNFQSSAPAIG